MLESAGKPYATISKQISIVSSKTIRKEELTTMSNDLLLLFCLFLVHTMEI